jgi:hypothetical protein
MMVELFGYERFSMRRPRVRPPYPYRDDYVGRARLGLESPAQIESELKARGLPPLAVTPNPEEFDPMAEVWWTLAMAAAWVAFRTPDSVRQVWWVYRSEFRTWSGRHEIETSKEGLPVTAFGYELNRLQEVSLRDSCFDQGVGDKPALAPQDALLSLWSTLESGQLVAEGFPNGVEKRAPIRDAEWIDLVVDNYDGWRADPKGRWPADSIGAGERAPRFSRVRVRSARVVELWPASLSPKDIASAPRAIRPQDRRAACLQAFQELWPRGTPLGLMVQQRDEMIVGWFKTNGLPPPSSRTISRALNGVSD